MLATRVIPSILCRGRTLVKGQRFDSWRSVGLAAQAVRIHQARGVDELVLLDIGATPEGRGPDLDLVRELSEVCFMPLAVGGGVRTLDDVQALLRAGADKVVIGTSIWEARKPSLLKTLGEHFGSQAIVAAIDALDVHTFTVRCGTKRIHVTPKTAAIAYAMEGAGEILLTSVMREGTMEGYDLDLIRSVSQAVSIPVIAHGGCSGPEDMLAAIRSGAAGCAAGALFQFTDTTPKDCARYLAEHGVEARV